MLTHRSIWSGLDSLAAQHGMSVSALARKAGLDPTTFNRSKRVSRDGKPRWPSTESVAKVLDAVGASLPDLVQLMQDSGEAPRFQGRRIPVIPIAEAARSGFFDETGLPLGNRWDEVDYPDITDPDAFALEIDGDEMAPVMRDGDVVVVSPAAKPRRGDRVVLKTHSGDVLALELIRRTVHRVELTTCGEEARKLDMDARDVAWISRIVWIGQG